MHKRLGGSLQEYYRTLQNEAIDSGNLTGDCTELRQRFKKTIAASAACTATDALLEARASVEHLAILLVANPTTFSRGYFLSDERGYIDDVCIGDDKPLLEYVTDKQRYELIPAILAVLTVEQPLTANTTIRNNMVELSSQLKFHTEHTLQTVIPKTWLKQPESDRARLINFHKNHSCRSITRPDSHPEHEGNDNHFTVMRYTWMNERMLSFVYAMLVMRFYHLNPVDTSIVTIEAFMSRINQEEPLEISASDILSQLHIHYLSRKHSDPSLGAMVFLHALAKKTDSKQSNSFNRALLQYTRLFLDSQSNLMKFMAEHLEPVLYHKLEFVRSQNQCPANQKLSKNQSEKSSITWMTLYFLNYNCRTIQYYTDMETSTITTLPLPPRSAIKYNSEQLYTTCTSAARAKAPAESVINPSIAAIIEKQVTATEPQQRRTKARSFSISRKEASVPVKTCVSSLLMRLKPSISPHGFYGKVRARKLIKMISNNTLTMQRLLNLLQNSGTHPWSLKMLIYKCLRYDYSNLTTTRHSTAPSSSEVSDFFARLESNSTSIPASTNNATRMSLFPQPTSQQSLSPHVIDDINTAAGAYLKHHA